MQAQALVQVFLNMEVFGISLQIATDAPRFRTRSVPSSFSPHESEPGVLWLEDSLYRATGVELAVYGYDAVPKPEWDNDFGAVGAIRLEGCIQCVSLRNITFESQENGILLDAKYSGANITIDGIWSYDVPTPDEVMCIKSGDAIRVSNVLASDQASAFNVEGGSRIFLQGILVGGEYIDLHGCTTATTFGCPRVINAGVGSVIEGVKIE